MKWPALARRVGDRLRRISVGQRLTLTFLTVIILLLSTLSALYTTRTTAVLTGEVLSAARQTLVSAVATLSERFDEMRRVADLTGRQMSIRAMMERMAGGEPYPLAKQLADEKETTAFLARLEYTHDLTRVRLLLRGESLFADENVHYFRMSDEQLQRFSDLVTSGGAVIEEFRFPYIWQSAQRVFSLQMPLSSLESYGTVVAAIAVDIPSHQVEEFLRRALAGEYAAVILRGRDGQTILSSGHEPLRERELPAEMDRWIELPGGVMCYQMAVPGSDFTASFLIVRDVLFAQVSLLQKELAMMIGALLIVAFVLTFLTSALNARRIKQLASVIERVWRGDLRLRAPEGGGGEIGVLEKSFNHLLGTLDTMIQEKAHDQVELQKAEIRLLQSQIQPHFLYNTLDLINWRMMRARDEEGSRLVQALARFYKIGLSRGQEMILLREEIEHARLYVEIQNFRMDGRVALLVDAQERALDLTVTGNLLQPLVENAILHGIMEKPEGAGTVTIRAALAQDALTLSVEDDGVGIDRELAERAMREEIGGHFGLENVQRRVRLVYGGDSGLRFAARPGGGSIVTLVLRMGGASEPAGIERGR